MTNTQFRLTFNNCNIITFNKKIAINVKNHAFNAIRKFQRYSIIRNSESSNQPFFLKQITSKFYKYKKKDIFRQ